MNSDMREVSRCPATSSTVNFSVIWKKNVCFISNSKLNYAPNCFPESVNSTV